MKPALLNIFEMPKDHDFILNNKNSVFSHRQKFLSMLANSNSLKFLTIFTDKLYAKFNLF